MSAITRIQLQEEINQQKDESIGTADERKLKGHTFPENQIRAQKKRLTHLTKSKKCVEGRERSAKNYPKEQAISFDNSQFPAPKHGTLKKWTSSHQWGSLE